jgi:hypothetical protein
VIWHALSAAVGDLVLGLALAISVVVLLGALLYLEVRIERGRAAEKPADPEDISCWDSLPPKWSALRAESDLGAK